MACNGEYLVANEVERESKRVANLIIYVAVAAQLDAKYFFHKEMDMNQVRKSTGYYGNAAAIDPLVRILCDIVGGFDEEQMTRIVYDGRLGHARDLAAWWQRHQAADVMRVREEEAAKKKAKVREAALSKLSDEEKDALGIDD
jgi:hypothetical protein